MATKLNWKANAYAVGLEGDDYSVGSEGDVLNELNTQYVHLFNFTIEAMTTQLCWNARPIQYASKVLTTLMVWKAKPI